MMQLQSNRRSEIFRVRRLTGAIVLLALLAPLPAIVSGQNRMSPQQRELLASVPRGLPGDVLVQIRALGARMQVPGKEETVLTGQLIDAAGNPKDVRIVHQISGMVRIEGLRENISLTFDGDSSQGSLDRVDESLLETFVMDTVEGMVYSVRAGGAMRLLGRGFGPDPRVVPDYKGPRYDIFEVTAPVRIRQDRQMRLKRYYFDSHTGSLLSTRYTDPSFGRAVQVETRFSDWYQAEGSAYPGRIERFEDRNRVFSLLIPNASSRPQRDATNFR